MLKTDLNAIATQGGRAGVAVGVLLVLTAAATTAPTVAGFGAVILLASLYSLAFGVAGSF